MPYHLSTALGATFVVGKLEVTQVFYLFEGYERKPKIRKTNQNLGSFTRESLEMRLKRHRLYHQLTRECKMS